MFSLEKHPILRPKYREVFRLLKEFPSGRSVFQHTSLMGKSKPYVEFYKSMADERYPLTDRIVIYQQVSVILESQAKSQLQLFIGQLQQMILDPKYMKKSQFLLKVRNILTALSQSPEFLQFSHYMDVFLQDHSELAALAKQKLQEVRLLEKQVLQQMVQSAMADRTRQMTPPAQAYPIPGKA